MNHKLKNPLMDLMFEGILKLETKEECYQFFEDLCTINELQAQAQRFMVALMLHEGNTYLDICEKTGASTATISRVNRALNYGEDGYKLVINRLSKKDKNIPKD